jgi:hypothetical protein
MGIEPAGCTLFNLSDWTGGFLIHCYECQTFFVVQRERNTFKISADQHYDRAQSCGHVDGSLATIDFGPMDDTGLDSSFSMLSNHNGGGIINLYQQIK